MELNLIIISLLILIFNIILFLHSMLERKKHYDLKSLTKFDKTITFFKFWKKWIIIIFLSSQLMFIFSLLLGFSQEIHSKWTYDFSFLLEFNFKTFLLGLASGLIFFYPIMYYAYKSNINKLKKHSQIINYETVLYLFFFALFVNMINLGMELVILPYILPYDILYPETHFSFYYGWLIHQISSYLFFLLLFSKWEKKNGKQLMVGVNGKHFWNRFYTVFFQ